MDTDLQSTPHQKQHSIKCSGFYNHNRYRTIDTNSQQHMAAELKRKDDNIIILAMHPGEVATSVCQQLCLLSTNFYRDMANIELPWQVDDIITPKASVSAMIKVKTIHHSGTFWTWEDEVGSIPYLEPFKAHNL
jgi:hypothetical protein